MHSPFGINKIVSLPPPSKKSHRTALALAFISRKPILWFD
jgi:hypothetical protein